MLSFACMQGKPCDFSREELHENKIHKYSSNIVYFKSNFLTSVIIWQTIAMPIIKIPDSKTNDLHRFYQQRIQKRINPIGIASDMILPIKENTRP